MEVGDIGTDMIDEAVFGCAPSDYEPNPPHLEYDPVIVAETNKAICLTVRGLNVWFPKSQCNISSDFIAIDAWIFEQNIKRKKDES